MKSRKRSLSILIPPMEPSLPLRHSLKSLKPQRTRPLSDTLSPLMRLRRKMMEIGAGRDQRTISTNTTITDLTETTAEARRTPKKIPRKTLRRIPRKIARKILRRIRRRRASATGAEAAPTAARGMSARKAKLSLAKSSEATGKRYPGVILAVLGNLQQPSHYVEMMKQSRAN